MAFEDSSTEQIHAGDRGQEPRGSSMERRKDSPSVPAFSRAQAICNVMEPVLHTVDHR